MRDLEVRDLLVALVDSVCGAAEAGVDPRLRSAVGRTLLERLRAAILDGWREDQPVAAAMLDLMQRVEAVRRAIEPAWDHFSSRLSGPGGLDLVVEVAHDLRSPLTSILFLSEMLQRGRSGDINELQHHQLGLLYSAALGLSTVVSNVIEMARGGNQLAEEASLFSVREILEAVHDMVRPMAEEKRLAIQIAHPIDDQRLGYPRALSRVLLNLTTNALKFTAQGSVRIDAETKGCSGVEFSVRDSGTGIDPEALETLYKPFRRSDTGNGYAFSGTGLGLALSRKLVDAMGAELMVETQPGRGTRFYFELHLPTSGTANPSPSHPAHLQGAGVSDPALPTPLAQESGPVARTVAKG